MKKRVWLLVLGVVGLLGLVGYSIGRDLVKVKAEKGSDISIDFGNGKNIRERMVAGKSVFDGLEAVAKKDNLEVEVQKYDFGTLVEAIGDSKNTKEKAWMYYVDGKLGDKAADKFMLGQNDQVEWKYEKTNY